MYLFTEHIDLQKAMWVSN